MAEKITLVMSVPASVLDQSALTVEACDLSKGKMPLSEMLHAKKEVEGLLPLPSDLYAPKPTKVNDAHFTPENRAKIAFTTVTTRDAQDFIRDRNRAEKALAKVTTEYTFLQAALEARAAKAKKSA